MYTSIWWRRSISTNIAVFASVIIVAKQGCFTGAAAWIHSWSSYKNLFAIVGISAQGLCTCPMWKRSEWNWFRIVRKLNKPVSWSVADDLLKDACSNKIPIAPVDIRIRRSFAIIKIIVVSLLVKYKRADAIKKCGMKFCKLCPSVPGSCPVSDGFTLDGYAGLKKNVALLPCSWWSVRIFGFHLWNHAKRFWLSTCTAGNQSRFRSNQ